MAQRSVPGEQASHCQGRRVVRGRMPEPCLTGSELVPAGLPRTSSGDLTSDCLSGGLSLRDDASMEMGMLDAIGHRADRRPVQGGELGPSSTGACRWGSS